MAISPRQRAGVQDRMKARKYWFFFFLNCYFIFFSHFVIFFLLLSEPFLLLWEYISFLLQNWVLSVEFAATLQIFSVLFELFTTPLCVFCGYVAHGNAHMANVCLRVNSHSKARPHPAHYVLSQIPGGNRSLYSFHTNHVMWWPSYSHSIHLWWWYPFPLFIPFASCFFHISPFLWRTKPGYSPYEAPGGRREPLWNWGAFTGPWQLFIFININMEVPPPIRQL